MGNETNKSYEYRVKKGYGEYFQGRGLDIGCGNAPLSSRIFNGITELVEYDNEEGTSLINDGNTCSNLEDNSFDFVYSSHCLEHMDDPYSSFRHWIRVCKPGGTLFVSVPHEVLYEKCMWPSKFAPHYSSWTLEWESDLPKSVNVLKFIEYFEGEGLIEKIFAETVLENFSFRNFYQDQTLGLAICQIDFAVRKK